MAERDSPPGEATSEDESSSGTRYRKLAVQVTGYLVAFALFRHSVMLPATTAIDATSKVYEALLGLWCLPPFHRLLHRLWGIRFSMKNRVLIAAGLYCVLVAIAYLLAVER